MCIENIDLNLKQLKEYKPLFDKFLIESYSSPFIKQPFSQEIEICLKFMDCIADNLCSIVQKSNVKPLVSVIMPVYNRENVVRNAINSVLSQSYSNFELIIVDDASTDGTVNLLKKIKHDKIRVFYHDVNKGSSGARNTGLKKANGQYITYLDSDNLMDEKFIEANIGAFFKLPDAYCIYSGQSRQNNYNTPIQTILFGSLNKSQLKNRNFVDTNTIFHKKEVLDKIGGFNETLHREEDWEFILKICNNYKTYGIPILQSKYYTNLVDNRLSDLESSNLNRIQKNNFKFHTSDYNLNKKVNIVIPIYNNLDNLKECLGSIFSLKLGNKLKVIISNNNSQIKLCNLDLDDFKDNDIVLVESKSNLKFSDSLNQGIKYCEDDADILILNQYAILTKGSIESMQKYAYSLNECGLIVSRQLVQNSPLINKYFKYIHDIYWIDIAPFRFKDNIVKIPWFYDDEFLELKAAPFFCTYLKREVLKQLNNYNFKFKDSDISMFQFSQVIRHFLELKIFVISDANVFQGNQIK